MKINVLIGYPDGTQTIETSEFPDQYFELRKNFTQPTDNERIAALEAATLAIMEVQNNV